MRDPQRRSFYKTRQSILEGRNLREIIFETIEDAVRDSVDHYLARDYTPTCIGEWVRSEFNTAIDPGDLRDTELAVLEMTIRDKAREEARTNIHTSLSEFMDPDADPLDWDYAGLSTWAATQFHVQVSPGQLKTLDREHIADTLVQKALDQIDHKDCSPIARYLVPNYAQQQLAQWASDKFDLSIEAGELVGKTTDQAVDIILQQAQAAYRRREIEYPIDYAMEATNGAGGTANIYASEQLAVWLRAKYGAVLTGDEIRAMSPEKLRSALLEVSASANAGIDAQVKEAVDKFPESAALAAWVSTRFVTQAPPDEFEGESTQDRVERITELAHAFMRRELTELERTVLLQIYDVAWKDHLYAMDQLRDSIGLRGIAQRDPVIEYKREGSRLFDEFLRVLRDKVTEIIFRVKVASSDEMRDVYADQQESFEVPESYGVDAAAIQQAAQQPAAGSDPDEDPDAVQPTVPIINAGPKVGRNDPCPCGSGKKFKQCCGKNG